MCSSTPMTVCIPSCNIRKERNKVLPLCLFVSLVSKPGFCDVDQRWESSRPLLCLCTSMDPRALRKLYGRTGTVIVNGYFNTDWDEVAATSDAAAKANVHKVGPKTNFATAHLEDSIAFTISKYSNGIHYRAPRHGQGRGYDNNVNIPTSSLVSGLPGDSPSEVLDGIHVLGLHLGEGAIQAGGSGRTYNWGRQEFYPGQLIGAAVPPKDYVFANDEDRDNVHLMPMPINSKTLRTCFLDRGRTLSALRSAAPVAIPLVNAYQAGIANQFQARVNALSDDAKEVIRVTLRRVVVEQATKNVNNGPLLDDVRLAADLIDKHLSVQFTQPISATVAKLADRVNKRLAALLVAYATEAQGLNSKAGMAIIEPLEQDVMDQIDRKNNVLRHTFAVAVAPVSQDTLMIPLNMSPYSR